MSHHVWHRASPALVGHEHEHVHSQGLVDPSIVRSRAGVKAVAISLGVFILLYGVLAVVDGVLMVRYSRRQLAPAQPPDQAEARVPAMTY